MRALSEVGISQVRRDGVLCINLDRFWVDLPPVGGV